MNRAALDDGRWFDVDRAEKWEEDTFWDGSNCISKATGSQWDHEALYSTASDNWVLNCWSQWRGSRETYTLISEEEAAKWLVKNGHSLPGRLCEFESALEV